MGLGDEGQMSRSRGSHSMAGIESDIRDDDTERVRPDDAHIFKAAGNVDDLFFQLPALCISLAETAGEDGHPHDACLAALLYDPRDITRRRADHRQVRNFRQAGEIWIRGDTADRFDAEADGVNDAAKTRAEKIRQHLSAEVPGILLDPDQGHPTRLEDLLKVANAHDRLSIRLPPGYGQTDGSPDIR